MRAEIREVAEMLVEDGIFDIVVSAIYSPLNSEYEIPAGNILLKRMKELCTVRGPSVQPRVTL